MTIRWFSYHVFRENKTKYPFKYKKIYKMKILVANFDYVWNESGFPADVFLNIRLVLFFNLGNENIEDNIDEGRLKAIIAGLYIQAKNHF